MYGLQNDVIGTLSASYTSGGTSLQFTLSGNLNTPPPSGQLFYAKVDSEYFLVSSWSLSMGTYTATVAGAQVGSVAANHASSAPIVICWLVPPVLQGLGMCLVEEHTASSSSELDFTTGITSAFDEYELSLNDIVLSANADLGIQMSTNGGSSYDTGNNYGSEFVFAYTTTSAGGQGVAAASAASMSLRSGSGTFNLHANGSINATLRFKNPGGSLYKVVLGTLTWYDASLGIVVIAYSGLYSSTTAVNAFRLLPSSGNISSGVARLYGIAK